MEHWNHWHEPDRTQGILFDPALNAIQAAHDDLAEAIERIERRLEEPHLHITPDGSPTSFQQKPTKD